MTLGSRICTAREIAGYTPQQLAQRIGVMAKTLRNWEADRAEPRANRMVTLAGVLGVPLAWLAQGEDGGGADGGSVMTLEETRPLKVKMARLVVLHEQMGRLMGDLRSDIDRLQARIDQWDLEIEQAADE